MNQYSSQMELICEVHNVLQLSKVCFYHLNATWCRWLSTYLHLLLHYRNLYFQKTGHFTLYHLHYWAFLSKVVYLVKFVPFEYPFLKSHQKFISFIYFSKFLEHLTYFYLFLFLPIKCWYVRLGYYHCYPEAINYYYNFTTHSHLWLKSNHQHYCSWWRVHSIF